MRHWRETIKDYIYLEISSDAQISILQLEWNDKANRIKRSNTARFHCHEIYSLPELKYSVENVSSKLTLTVTTSAAEFVSIFVWIIYKSERRVREYSMKTSEILSANENIVSDREIQMDAMQSVQKYLQSALYKRFLTTMVKIALG